jgi:lysozyme family protein
MPPSQDRFAACAAAVTAARGAYREHDPVFDGPSAHGIGLGLLSVWIGGPADAAMLRGLEPEVARRILRGMVWAPLGAGRLRAGPDLALFAYAMEAGTMQALADLQAELGVDATGAPDAPTIAAARRRAPRILAAAIRAAHDAWRAGRGLPALVPPPARRARRDAPHAA